MDNLHCLSSIVLILWGYMFHTCALLLLKMLALVPRKWNVMICAPVGVCSIYIYLKIHPTQVKQCFFENPKSALKSGRHKHHKCTRERERERERDLHKESHWALTLRAIWLSECEIASISCLVNLFGGNFCLKIMEDQIFESNWNSFLPMFPLIFFLLICLLWRDCDGDGWLWRM